jgi:hypothetical protein
MFFCGVFCGCLGSRRFVPLVADTGRRSARKRPLQTQTRKIGECLAVGRFRMAPKEADHLTGKLYTAVAAHGFDSPFTAAKNRAAACRVLYRFLPIR